MALCPRIHRAGGLIQNQDRRLRYGCPGNIQKLPLPLGEIGPVLLQNSVVAMLQILDEEMCRGDLRCLLHLLIRGVQPSVPDVFPHRTGKQVRILQHHGNIAAQKSPLDPFDGNSVHSDGSRLNIIKPG